MNNILKLMGFIVALFGAQNATAQTIDLNTPEGAIAANRKLNCSTNDNQPIFFTWEGNAFSRRMGEADIRLFKISGMNVRQCVSIEGGKKGKGYRMVTREIMLYLDPETGLPLDRWINPITNQEVDVFHVMNDPVNGRPSFPYDEEGKPVARFFGRVQNDSWFLTLPIPLFYNNVLGGDYQKYVGGAYHATELFNFMGNFEDLVDANNHTAEDVKVGWVRISNWLPWMEMQGREGMVYFQAAGQKVRGFDDLPKVLKDYINDVAPLYKLPPPGDDDRPNQTSWSYFKGKTKGSILPRGGHN